MLLALPTKQKNQDVFAEQGGAGYMKENRILEFYYCYNCYDRQTSQLFNH